MSIHDKRLRIEIDNVIRRNLSKGYVPTANEVIGELSRYLADNNLSVPSYKFTKKTRSFTADELDKAKQETLQDLEILYSSLVELHELSEEQINKFAVEKKKYDYKLASLESELTSMVNKYSTSGYTMSRRNGFADMEGVNLASTTADIDIVHCEATLKRLYDIPFKDFSVSADAQLEPDVVLIQSGDLIDYIDLNGIVWQGIVERNEQVETVLTLNIDTKSVNQINKLEIDMPLLKKCMASVYASVDGDKWSHEYTGEVVNRCTTNFSTKLRYIRVVLSKVEADKFLLGKYLYYFLIDSIKLDKVNYTLESDVVSRPIKPGSSINKISIVSEAIIPPATSIQYYVASNSQTPNWIPISPANEKNKKYPSVISFNTVEADHRLAINLPSGVSNDAYELKSLSVNGQRMFAIAEIPGVEVTNYKLFKGMNAWKVESLPINVAGPQTQSLFIQNMKSVIVSYFPVLVDKPGLIMNGEQFSASTVRRYSTAIYREGGDTVVKEMIASSHPVTVCLNGNILYKGTPSGGVVIAYPFKKGTNVLEVIVNVSAVPVAASLDLNLNVLSMGSTICGNKDPMEPVSLFNLRYNTNNKYDVYTLHKTGDEYMVIVKDPDLSIRYDLVYDYVVKSLDEMLIKATLKREHASINVTPKLLSYEVRFI